MITHLPDDVNRIILGYVHDIPTLSSLMRTSKLFPLSMLAAEDATWAFLVKRRFDITGGKIKHLGGDTWMEAYKSLSRSNRIPRSKFTSKRKVTCATNTKGSDSNEKLVNAEYAKDVVEQESDEGLSIWLMVGHTENCLVRTLSENDTMICGGEREVDSATWQPHFTGNKTYIELHICVQNIKSASTSFYVDFHKIEIRFAGSARLVNVIKSGRLKPRILHERRNHKKNCQESVSRNKIDPLEYVVVAINIQCPSGIVYETDFLSQAKFAYVPVKKVQNKILKKREYHTNCSKTVSTNGMNVDAFFKSGFLLDAIINYNEEKEEHIWGTVCYNTVLSAEFITEREIWKQYSELPGGFLARIESHR